MKDALPQILILDVDGTLLTPDKVFTARAAAAVRAASAAGIRVSLATGRMYEAVAHWVRELGLDAPQIGNNGADIVNPDTGERFVHVQMRRSSVDALLDRAAVENCLPVLFSGERVLAPRRTDDLWLIERNNEPVDIVPDTVLRDPSMAVEKVLFLDRSNPEQMQNIHDEIADARDGRKLPPMAMQITESGILNFGHPKATKVSAVGWLCAYLGLPLSSAAAVGDGANDTEMIRAVGLGIAMGNAVEETRQAADATVADNEHDGVVEAIRQYVLRENGE